MTDENINPEEEPAPEASMSASKEAERAASIQSGDWLRIREDVPAWLRWALGVIPVAAVIGIWWLLTAGAEVEQRMISPTILPSPFEVLQSFRSLWFERALTRNALISFVRVLSGFAVGVLIAFPLGLLMGAFSKVKAMFSPISVFGAYLPIPALVPLTMSLFGIGESQKVAFLALAFVIYLLPLIVQSVDDVDDIYLKTAYTLGASTQQTVRKVMLAISWPDIYQALRLGFGIGWSYIILAEMVDIEKGLGGIIIISQRRGPREHIYLVLLVIVVMAFVTDKLWAVLGKKLFPYREKLR